MTEFAYTCTMYVYMLMEGEGGRGRGRGVHVHVHVSLGHLSAKVHEKDVLISFTGTVGLVIASMGGREGARKG